jgi:hypothetical protein
LTIEKLEYQYLDQNSSAKDILLYQTFSNYNLKLNKSNVCEVFEETTNYINIRITYSPNETVSVVELRFKVNFVENATINELNITLSLNPYRKCIVDERTEYSNHMHFWTFICELNSLTDSLRTLPNSIEFFFISEKIFRLAICGINVYNFQNECGIPDVPLHASYYRRGFKSFEYFPTHQRNKHLMIGDGVINCLREGNWDKEPPIFEPIIKCNTNEINMTSKLYKDFKLENFEFFNKTQIAVIDSKIIFKCFNEENSSEPQVSICNENGLWIGNDLKCKLETKIKKQIFSNFSGEMNGSYSNKSHSNESHSNKSHSNESHSNKSHSNESHSNKSHLFSIDILLSIVVFVLIICIIIGTIFIMRRKNLRKKRFNSCNTKNLYINDIYEETNFENNQNYDEIIDSNLVEDVYNQIYFDQLNTETNETVEYAAV